MRRGARPAALLLAAAALGAGCGGGDKPDATALDADAVREFCAGRIAHYKVPRYVHVVEGFPMTVTGKVRKVEMPTA